MAKKKKSDPYVRRMFPDLFAHKVVGVQPLSSPMGLAYAMRFATHSDKEEKLTMTIVKIRAERKRWTFNWIPKKNGLIKKSHY